MFAHPLFDKAVHTLRIGLRVFTRKGFPSRVELQCNRIVRLADRDGGYHFCICKRGNAAQSGNRCRLNTEEIHKNRIVASEILIGQIQKRRAAFAELFDEGAQPFGAPDKEDVVVAVAAFQNLCVQYLVFWWEYILISGTS